MRSPYDDFSVVTGNGSEDTKANSYNNNNNSAIPYHARENSLPFSYGQINMKTSTPLRTVNANTGPGGRYREDYGGGYGTTTTTGIGTTPTKAGLNFGSEQQHYYGTNYDTKNTNNNNNTNGLTATLKSTTTTMPATGSSTDKTNTTTIKAQPRLTSPILVRKTLNSRSPTRSNGSTPNTNTIANTYHYKYGSDNDSLFGGGGGSSSSGGGGRDNNTLNGNISGYNNNTNNGYGSTRKYNNNNNLYNSNFDFVGGGDTIDGSAVVRKTQPRDDFEELLRERREKVMREHYRTAGSTTPTTLTNGTSPNSRKFNYDFEFHLNLDDEAAAAAPQPPRRAAYTIERTPSSSLQQQQQYRTREIPVERGDEVVNVERNYHTISSTNANRGDLVALQRAAPPPQQQRQQQQQYESLYSTVEKRTIQQPSQRRQYTPSLTPSPTQQLQQPQTQLQQQHAQRRLEYTTYGNGNAAGYGYGYDSNSNNEYATTIANNRSSLGATVVARSRNDLSTPSSSAAAAQQQPIYATTTKQQQQIMMNTATTAYGGNRNTYEPELSITDHALTANSSMLPIGPTPNVAAAAFGTGKISPLPSSAAYIATRPETPAFPVTPRTPHGGGGGGQNSPMGGYAAHNNGPLPRHNTPTLDLPNGKSMLDLHNYSSETIYRTSCRPRLDSNMSVVNSEPQEVAAHLVKFAKDSSKYWYKPNLSREEAVQLLLHAEPGTFLVRNSTTYKDNYGLVVRVHQPPPNSELTGQPDDLVRHFLIEPTKHGVRLKSCANEPVFTSLSALIYEHSINKLALPCLLHIPDHDLVPSLIEPTSAQKQLLTQGAACNVLWLFSSDTESLTGAEAIRKAIRQLYAQQPLPVPTEVHFKVTQQGITLTDNTRKKFFRKHYPGDSISFCAIDPDHRLWSMQLTSPSTTSTEEDGGTGNAKKTHTSVGALKKTIFAFVARNSPKSKDNQCHVFCDLDIHQPASAIVSFVNKTLPTERERNFVL